LTRIGFIGAGKVGFSLGRLMFARGMELSGYASCSYASAEEAAGYTGSRAYQGRDALVAASDVVFVTVPDDAIRAVWLEVSAGGGLSGKLFCHTSGLLASDVFEGARELGASAASLHPLMAVPDRLESWTLLADALYAAEGDPDALLKVGAICDALGVRYGVVAKEGKALYHCAASMVSNCAVALAYMGESAFAALGLADSVPGLWGLMVRNTASVAARGPAAALTGPVERADSGTVRAHLSALSGDDRELYRRLCQKLVELSRVKHPGRDYGPLLAVLESFRPEPGGATGPATRSP
jgi:predicted short-subunit dehydrogenase-like oxidoreductase (DUF2520 family)